MICIRLSDAEADCLELARKLRDRFQIVRMAHRGRPHPEIAAELAAGTRTVQRRLNVSLGGGPYALRSRNATDRPPKVPTASAAHRRPLGRLDPTDRHGTAHPGTGWSGR